MYYRAVNTNHIFSEGDADLMRGAFGPDKFEHDIKEGLIEILDPPPTVIDLLKNGNEHLAVIRYMEIHAVPSRQARKMVGRIKKDMERIRAEYINKK